MTKTVKRLSGLEIDEVSLVDRPANQHGLVTITKRDGDTGMSGLFDEQGNEVDESQLESGDVVFDADGDAVQLFSDEDLQELLDSGQIDADEIEYADEDEDELVGVGKAGAAISGGKSTVSRVIRGASNLLDETKTGFAHGRGRTPNPSSSVSNAGRNARSTGAHLGRNKNAYIAAGAAGTEENVRSRFTKSASLGDQVLSDLSKALTDGDRDQVISKAMERVGKAEQAAQEAISKAERLEEEAEFATYVDIAKGFELPVDPEDLGGILQEVSKVLTNEQLDTLERILHAAAAAVEYEELGSAGGSPVMGYVDEHAYEMVGKSAGDITPEQATTALFSANDDAYLAYLSENQR